MRFYTILSAYLCPILAAALVFRELYYRKLLKKERAERLKLIEEKKKIHHKVKNDLQILVSLINLQINSCGKKEIAAALEKTCRRVFAASLIHQQLYKSSDTNEIVFEDFITAFANRKTAAAFISVDAKGVTLPAEKATAVGLFIDEALENACAYGRGEGDLNAPIKVAASVENGVISLSIKDSGPGLPDPKKRKKSGALGLTLMEALARQLNGALNIESGGGTKVTLEFPAD